MSGKSIFSGYLKELAAVARQGDAREESFYSALSAMLGETAREIGVDQARVTTLPKATDAGNPDFRVWNGRDRIIGYIEAKRPGEERLDAVERSEQLKRYRATFPNLILTNFLEFRLYRDGELTETTEIGQPVALNQFRAAPPVVRPDKLFGLLERFLGFSLPQSYTAESLAVELAKRTRFLRDIVEQELTREKDKPGTLTGFFEAFQTYLIGTLSERDFADLFAQTIAYGLFAARIRAGEKFDRVTAFSKIPHTIGVLRDLFRFLSLDELPGQLAWCVDDIAEVLAVADAPGILDRYYHEGRGSDPIVHFYETFLAKYDPAEREKRGVYYTPEPVVGYIVRSLHGLLKTKFGKPDGLASEGVTLLDPAAGTMTFVAKAAQQAVKEFEGKYGTGGRADFIRNHILKNFYAFELMMAPYAVGHLKMSFFLEELGHRMTDDERIPFYLTNTLDNEELEDSRLPGFSALAEESRLAGEVKKQTPILAILGNPPYSGHSTNIGEWIRGMIDTYKQVDGKPLGERNPKWLQDDYVKFIRFAQWKIDQAGKGVAGMITNHGYLDNPTFRGMRQSLMQSFDEIYILDLHGNSLKKETCPDGGLDQNVFDIRQGVAIVFFIKYGNNSENNATVYHADLWGTRERKYHWLDEYDQSKTEWVKLEPASPSYLFRPYDVALMETYRQWPAAPEIFPVNSVGVVTARDSLVFDFDRETLKRRVRQLRDPNLPDEAVRNAYALKDKKNWSLNEARKTLYRDHEWEQRIVPCLYRPFDRRWLFYYPQLIERGRFEVMRHMLAGANLGLIARRQMLSSQDCNYIFVSNMMISDGVVRSDNKGSESLFPLYLYPENLTEDLFMVHDGPGPRPNLNPELTATLTKIYGEEPTPGAIFYYIYAVLYAPAYREKYAEFLRIDFPRVPFTANLVLFQEMATLGERLTRLHLLDSPELDPPACRFEGQGDSRVEKGRKDGLRYEPDSERVYINAAQYFAPVPEEVWSYRIGGYQVCEKWLKDRKERCLELDDIRTYCRIVTALGLTIDLQRQINTLYPEIEKKILSAINAY